MNAKQTAASYNPNRQQARTRQDVEGLLALHLHKLFI